MGRRFALARSGRLSCERTITGTCSSLARRVRAARYGGYAQAFVSAWGVHDLAVIDADEFHAMTPYGEACRCCDLLDCGSCRINDVQGPSLNFNAPPLSAVACPAQSPSVGHAHEETAHPRRRIGIRRRICCRVISRVEDECRHTFSRVGDCRLDKDAGFTHSRLGSDYRYLSWLVTARH